MTPSALLERLRGAGVSARAEGGTLWLGPPGKLTDELRRLCKRHKSALLAYLEFEQLVAGALAAREARDPLDFADGSVELRESWVLSHGDFFVAVSPQELAGLERLQAIAAARKKPAARRPQGAGAAAQHMLFEHETEGR